MVASLGLAALLATVNAQPLSPDYNKLWVEFKAEFGREYNGDAEESERFEIFKTNVDEIYEINMDGESSWTAGLNEMSDMSWEEFKTYYNLEPQNCAATQPREKITLPPARFPAANNKDWRKDIPIHVKNQGSCGSCWAFSTTGATEAHNYLATGKDVQLAEQQLVDCANHFDCHGCNGGLPSKAFEYLHYFGGQMSESDYRYTAKTQSCKAVASKVAAVVESQVNITYKDEDQLVEGLAQHGPVSIAYQVASDFRHYTGGVYDSKTCKSRPQDVNHAVLVVGFDTDSKSGKDYYIVKNSWGSSFGIEGGYFWMVRGKNMCGVGDCAAFPVMKGETELVA